MADHLRRIDELKLRVEAPGIASAITEDDRVNLQGKSESASSINVQLSVYGVSLGLAKALDVMAAQAEIILSTMSSPSTSLAHDDFGKVLDAYDKMNAAWRHVASEKDFGCLQKADEALAAFKVHYSVQSSAKPLLDNELAVFQGLLAAAVPHVLAMDAKAAEAATKGAQ